MTINQVFCPWCLGALAVIVLVYFTWALCRIAALSDQAMEEMNELHLNVMMPDDLLDALDAFAAEHGYNRSEAARLAVWRMLNAPEPYIAPALPNWRVAAWTSLLRGVFGTKHLVLTDEIKPMLRDAVAALNERESQVLSMRFGLDGPRHTLKEVGAAQGVKRERARQIEVQALRRVRRWCRDHGIWDLLKEQLEKEK